MYPPEVAERVRNLLKSGTPEREVARIVHVSRGFVHTVRCNKRRRPFTFTPYEKWLNAPVARCDMCGASTRLPCLACALRNGRSHPAIRRAIRLGCLPAEGLMHRQESPRVNQNDEGSF
jgi:hypothetical protein